MEEEQEQAPAAGVGRPTSHGASDETVISRRPTQDQPDTFTRTEQLLFQRSSEVVKATHRLIARRALLMNLRGLFLAVYGRLLQVLG